MKRFLIFILLVLFTLVIDPNCIFSGVTVGEEIYESTEFKGTEEVFLGVGWMKRYHWPNAGYISLHFSDFSLKPGDHIEISNPDGSIKVIYEGNGKIVQDGKKRTNHFWARHIPGETAIVKLISGKSESTSRFKIDKWAHGYNQERIISEMGKLEKEAYSDIEAICGQDDKEWAKCYVGTTMYTRARAVSRLLINGTSACTGWLLGSEGHLITNNHCIGNQDDANNTDYEFMAEGADCDTNCSGWFSCPGTVEASSATLVKTNDSLDYTLVLLPKNVTSSYGYLQFRNTLPEVGEHIYIPQHAAGKGKQLAVKCDIEGGPCKVVSIDQTPCIGGPGDIGYYADTEGGSSGSPVLACRDNLVVALHHCAKCPNRGVPIPSIISDLGSNLPANAVKR
jgi:hypothetical protein